MPSERAIGPVGVMVLTASSIRASSIRASSADGWEPCDWEPCDLGEGDSRAGDWAPCDWAPCDWGADDSAQRDSLLGEIGSLLPYWPSLIQLVQARERGAVVRYEHESESTKIAPAQG